MNASVYTAATFLVVGKPATRTWIVIVLIVLNAGRTCKCCFQFSTHASRGKIRSHIEEAVFMDGREKKVYKCFCREARL